MKNAPRVDARQQMKERGREAGTREGADDIRADISRGRGAADAEAKAVPLPSSASPVETQVASDIDAAVAKLRASKSTLSAAGVRAESSPAVSSTAAPAADDGDDDSWSEEEMCVACCDAHGYAPPPPASKRGGIGLYAVGVCFPP